MKKLNFLGAGPRIGRIALPYLAVAIVLTLVLPSVFTFGETAGKSLLVAGICVTVVGLVLYALTVRSLLGGLRETRLVTTGLYRYCQNPLYAVILLLIVPGVGLIMNSWLILTTSILGYTVFKMHIGSEYREMSDVFGEEYEKYRAQTPEFFPFIK